MVDQLLSPDVLPLQEMYASVRRQSVSLVSGLSDADATVQSMEDASPAKWHLAHTSWFFETFVLMAHDQNYQAFDPSYNYLFNSYYETVGTRHPRPARGMLTRPSLDDVLIYRQHVDDAMMHFLNSEISGNVRALVELGLQHEQQHQELLLTDILHMFAQNPLKPAFRSPGPLPVAESNASEKNWLSFAGGIFEAGHDGDGFCFDCETPQHEVLVRPYQLANRAVTNGEWSDFIDDGGYDCATLWLADGWDIRIQENWTTPLYWEQRDGAWQNMTLIGMQPVDLLAPVTHISFFEADAFARWAEARVPTEQEWEVAAMDQQVEGNFSESNMFRPRPQLGPELNGLFGDVWEWTQSPFTPYPGFKIADGAVGEYNGKFMSGQMVLKGGSCATPKRHIRASYRNFFHPQKRWQFSGLRLARDC